MPRAEFAPTAEQRRTVETMAGYGVPEADIAAVLDIDPKTLRKHFREQLDLGHVKANSKVTESLFRRANGYQFEAQKVFVHKGTAVVAKYTEHVPPDVTACIFWLKTRAGWSEYAPPPSPKPREEPLGKKAQADAAARTAQRGTGWNDLVH